MKYNLKISILFFCIIKWHSLQSIEYIYPICTDSSSIFYIHQKSLNDAELWRYVIASKEQIKCLDWRFMPAGVKLLPDHQSFSFIDTGRLRIKNFLKRSPHTIDFDRPVYGVSEVNWVDNNLCYFSAKQKKHYDIFWGNVATGTITSLYQKEDVECLGPRILDEQLFCIERCNHDRSCRIILKNLASSKIETIVDCGYQQVVYLQMLSPLLGFYIEHMPYINDESELITFICHKIESLGENQDWKETKVFKFNVLKKYLIGNDRLYESLIPFLPRAKKTILYLTDIKQNQEGKYYSLIKSYDLISTKFESILESNTDIVFFAPLLTNNNQLVYGKIGMHFSESNCVEFDKFLITN